jgi:hypothetical protein
MLPCHTLPTPVAEKVLQVKDFPGSHSFPDTLEALTELEWPPDDKASTFPSPASVHALLILC